MSYTLYTKGSSKGINLWVMDWLRKLVAKYPSVKNSQFLCTFNCTTAHGIYMSPSYCTGTAKALLLASIKDIVLTASDIGFNTSDATKLYEVILGHAEWFKNAAENGGCHIWG